MITVDDPDLSRRLVDRSTVAADEEAAIRRAAYEAVEVLVETSGRDMGAVDRFLFEMRHRCPESSEPDCARCPADPVCEHRTRLFQPVFRTTAY